MLIFVWCAAIVQVLPRGRFATIATLVGIGRTMDSDVGFDLSTVFSTGLHSGGTDVGRPDSVDRRQHISFVDVGGVRLRLSVTGEGPPLLFLFGSGAAATIENALPIVDRLSPFFTVACPDQRGLGESDVPPGPWTMADYASDGFGVADHLGWDRFRVLGVSFGGMVALEMAASHPQRCERLVLLGTSPGGAAHSYPLHELEKLTARERFRVFPQILDIRVKDRERPAGRMNMAEECDDELPEPAAGADSDRRERGLALQLEARRGHDVAGRLGRIDCPTFIGAGKFDGLAPLANAKMLRDEIVHSELHVYEFGHLFFAEPQALDDSLTFLRTEQHSPADDRTAGGAMPTMPALDWRSLTDLFADQAERSPEAIAIRFDGESLTYGQLAQRSNRLARVLIERGVGPDSIVPILMDRCPSAIVAILGVLAAGGAYLPMDPDAPLVRTQLMAEDAGAALMLTATRHLSTAAALGCAEILVLDDPDLVALLAGRSAERVSDRDRVDVLLPQHMAFVVYTSGSTGAPKGSRNTQAGLTNFMQWLRHENELGPDDRVLHQTTLIFDMAAAEIFLPLISGGVLVIARPRKQIDPGYIAELIDSEAVSWVCFVPSLLQHFFDGNKAAAGASLRHIVCAGEVLTGRLQSLCHSRLPDVTLWNSYGPSEAALGVTLWRCRRADGDTAPPIGFPGPGVEVHILGDDLQPVVTGTPAELFVAGVPLSRGYLQRPELTAERFLPCASGPPGALMYRTGDVVSIRQDGALEIHGRRDNQIKINGVRIEPGEVEAAIAELPGISEAAVIVRDLGVGPQLIAYLIAEPGSRPPNPVSLSAELARRLPWAMVPGYFVVLDAFPRTASGKLAFRELPAPDLAADKRIDHFTGAEKRVRDLWVDVLGHEQFGTTDNFFMVGGRSLGAAVLQARLEDQLGRDVPLPHIFRFATIREQAEWLVGHAPTLDDCLVTLQPLGDRAPLFAVHGWGGKVGHFVDLAHALAPDRPVIGVQFTGDDPAQSSVADLADQYAERILRYRPHGPIHLIGASAGGWYAYAVAGALLERGAQVGVLAVLDSQAGGARVHRRLRLALLMPTLRFKLQHGNFRYPPSGQTRSAYFRERLAHHLARLRQYLRLGGRANPGDASGDPFQMLSRKGFRPRRLPVTAHLFSPPHSITRLRRTWRFYALGGVHCVPLFNDHTDFWVRPELAPQLATAVRHALARHEEREVDQPAILPLSTE